MFKYAPAAAITASSVVKCFQPGALSGLGTDGSPMVPGLKNVTVDQ